VATTGAQFVELVAASDANAMATEDWSVADTAAHVATISLMYTHLVRFDEPAIAGVQRQVLTTNVDNVSDLNAMTLKAFTERDTATLAERLRSDIDEILRATEDVDPSTPVTWLGDSRVPICGVLAHLVNELQIHGRDIARATGTPWTIPPADAALFFEVFFVEMLRHEVGHLLDNDEPPSDRRIAVEFRSRHTTPVTIVLHKGVVSVEEPGGATDLRIFFDPPAFNLMLFHRISKARAALTGKVVVWGRRPWLLPRFLRTVRCP
jgi:Mycothiol maleylpyruvate isomerase N-terminal domain